MNQSGGGDAIGIVLLILAALVGIAIFVVYIATVIWAYGDAEKRGKSGCLVAILVAFLSWPIGLVVWLVARPDKNR